MQGRTINLGAQLPWHHGAFLRVQYSVSAIFVCIAVSHQSLSCTNTRSRAFLWHQHSTVFKAGAGAGIYLGSQVKGGYSFPRAAWMSVCIRPLHLDAVRCPGEPGWVQLSCGRRARRGDSLPRRRRSSSSPSPSPCFPGSSRPPRPKGSRSVCCIPGAAGEPAPARRSRRCRATGRSRQR